MSAPVVATVNRSLPNYGAYKQQPWEFAPTAYQRTAFPDMASSGTPRTFHPFSPPTPSQHQNEDQKPQRPPPPFTDHARSESMPIIVSRPRRLSGTNTGNNHGGESPARNGAPPRPQQPFGPPTFRPRTSSWSGPRTVDGQMVGYSTYQSPPVAYRVMALPGEIFAALPGEVLGLILEELNELHLGPGSESCATCWMRDLCSLSLASRKWYRFARTALYENVMLIGIDSQAHKKRLKLAQGSRLLLLRRTLRSNSHIAAAVRSLKAPAPLFTAPRAHEEYMDLVASVIMACPNLERLVGMSPRYTHNFSRLFHALASRRKLKQMEWILEAAPPVQKQGSKSSRAGPPSTATMELNHGQATAFLDLHIGWAYLCSLTIHFQPGAPVMPRLLIDQALTALPSLEHLHLSHVPASSFTDSNLVSLPTSLRTLTLSHTLGVSPRGLSAFATRSGNRQTLKTLTLRHVRLDSLDVLARILSNLSKLEVLNVVQVNPPWLDEDTTIWLMPYLASPSLKKLHWDITSQAASPTPSAADSILARSIAVNGFPLLRQLRVLNDPDGAFQSLCQPVERIDLPNDRFRAGNDSGASSPASPPVQFPPTPNSSIGSPKSPAFPPNVMGPMSHIVESTNLIRARVAAQARLEAAHFRPRFFVNVIDHSDEVGEIADMATSDSGGILVNKFSVGGYIGDIGSKITYHLLAEPNGGSEALGGLVDVEDCLIPGAGGEDMTAGGDASGCSGRWNSGLAGGSSGIGGAGAHYEKGKQGRWWHTERGRWAPILMS